MDSTQTWGAVILAGGAGRRMGQDKALIDWGGRRAIDRVAAIATAVGARALVVGGGDYGLPFVRDHHPQAGPCGGVLHGAAFLAHEGCSHALVLAVDAPTIRAADLAPLMAASTVSAYEGLHVPFAAPLAAIPADAPDDLALWRLLDAMGVVRLQPSPAVLQRARGANTPAEREALLAAEAAPIDEAPGP